MGDHLSFFFLQADYGIGDQRMINDSQNSLFSPQGMRLVYNQYTRVPPSAAQPVFYQVPQNVTWRTNSGSFFANTDYVQTGSIANWGRAAESARRARQQEEECRKCIKDICDVGAKETEQTNLFASIALDVLGSKMADNPFEAGKKAVSVFQKLRRICVN